MAKYLFSLLALAATLTLPATANSGENAAAIAREPDDTLTVYSRERDVSEPLFKLFEQQTGIEIRARWGDPIDLAEQIIADGADSPADVFYGPLSDALGALSAAGRLAPLSKEQLDRVPDAYRSPDGTWVGTTGRAHVVFYNTDKLTEDDLPDSILGFTDPAWRDRIGFDPTSRSLQDAISAVSQLKGEDQARAWLQGLQANRPAAFNGAAPIVNAVSAGKIIDVGFGSHFYLYDLQTDGNAKNVAAKYYRGDPTGLLNVAGVGIIKSTNNPGAANAFVDFMLSRTIQQVYAQTTHEIPFAVGVAPAEGLPNASELTVPDLDVRQLEELRAARELLTEVGIIG